MSNIDFLVQNSTKKIIDLIKGLPDRKKLEAAFNIQHSQSESSSSHARHQRFTKHPRGCRYHDAVHDNSEDDDTTASTIRDEVVVIKTPRICAPQNHVTPNDSSDEYCDVTLRTEEFLGLTSTLEDHLGAFHLARDCALPSSSKDKARPKEKDKVKRSNKTIDIHETRSCEEYEQFLRELEAKNAKNKEKALALPGAAFQSLPHTPSASLDQSPHSRSNAICLASSLQQSQYESMLQDTQATNLSSPSELKMPSGTHSDAGPKTGKHELKVIMDLRMKSMVDRSIITLKECRSIFNCGVEPPDGLEDWERRNRRNLAFSSRFSRNYLYQLNRNKAEIEAILNPSGKARKTTNSYILGQRFYSVFQTIYIGLDAYKKHLPTGLVNGMPEKFRELLELVQTFIELFNSVNEASMDADADEAICMLSECCQSMLVDQSLMPSTRASSLAMSLLSKHGFTRADSGPQSRKRLSMYHVPVRKDGDYEYRIAMASKQKYQVPSKYKTATFKHRPPPQYQQASDEALNRKPRMPYVEPLQLKKPATVDGTTRRRGQKLGVIDIDSDVTTYVQDIAYASDGDVGEHFVECEDLRRHARGFFDKVMKDKQDMNAEEYACILDHFMEIIGEDKLPDGDAKPWLTQQMLEAKFDKKIHDMSFQDFVNYLVTYANSKGAGEACQSHAVEAGGSGEAARNTSSRGKTISVTGPSNAKLICVQESHSDSSNGGIPMVNSVDTMGILMRKLSRLSISQGTDSNELVYMERDKEPKEGRKSLKLDKVSIPLRLGDKVRPKGSRRVLESLSKNVMLNLIEYKLKYHKETKENFIYKKTADFATWVIIARISDAIMEDTLLTVTRDIQVDHILHKIYTQEFK